MEAEVAKMFARTELAMAPEDSALQEDLKNLVRETPAIEPDQEQSVAAPLPEKGAPVAEQSGALQPGDLGAVPQTRREKESRRHARVMRALYANPDPNVDLLLDEIEKAVRARRKIRDEEPLLRVPVTISQEAFNRVSYAAYARKLGKVEVLTYLLESYVPNAGCDSVPKWLLSTELETNRRTRHLSYTQSRDLEERFDWLMLRFRLVRVEMIETIINRYLPSAPFEVLPRPRRIAVDPT
jgi:hypothetical protein